MADEKIINTRILLKYDTLENWNKSTGILRAGEVAIATYNIKADIDSNTNAVNHKLTNPGTVPQVLVKVGDGTSTFAQLPYITAKAGDVYAWAKQAHPVYISGVNEETGAPIYGDLSTDFLDVLDRVVELEGFKNANSNIGEQINAAIEEALKGLANGDAAVARQFVTAAIQGEDGKVVVSRAALTADDIPELAQSKVTGLTGKLTELGAAIETEKTNREQDVADAETYAKGLVDALTEEGGAVKANADAIAVLQGKVGDVANVANAIATAKQEAISAAATDAQDKADAAQEAAEKYADDLVSALTDGETGSLKELAEKVNKNTAAIGEMPPAGEDGVAPTLVGLIAAAEKAADDAIKAEVTRATEAEGELENRLEIIETFFKDADADGVGTEGLYDALDTLKEIQDFIKGEGAAADELVNRVTQAEEDINALEEKVDVAKVSTAISGAIAPVNTAIQEEVARAKAAEEVNATAAKAADDKAVVAQEAADKAQDEIDALELVVGTPDEGKTIVEMIAAATYNDAEVRSLIAENTTAIEAEEDRATKAEAAIKAEIGVDENGNYATLNGYDTLINAINAANGGVATNAAAIEVLNGDVDTDGSVAKAVADLKTELTEDIKEAANGRVKTITGDNYIQVDDADPQNVKLTFDVSNIVLVAGDSTNLDPATT